ncbi:C22orf13, putative isoform 2 [Hibiscus syriacus]|uniref:C22orf13, putative isoform 2 n=1 Tax=Hibiscus syriacus TaxID=106335 RepID=A0A6A3CZK1_HIBSY|nr:guanylyl cyclase 1-like isoform X2 [Hibiscus syriacus]XP_039004233.1 guanylyl cyclase 1-like isoform X2 [Hibiscus syriacus]KAE8732878.1 C22orf13, putative isoform 2 [Hibiscus syriacus]
MVKILKTDEDDDEGYDEECMNVAARFGHFELSSGNRISHDGAMLHRSHFVQVSLVNQLFSWDCGLACVSMALTTVGVDDCGIENLAELCCTTSIWTVDLAYLLQRFSVRFFYYTVTFGANPNYSDETYYKEQLPTDLVRVDSLFKKAVEAGIDIGCRSISGEELSRWILSGKYIAIALVDQYKLSQSWMEDVIIHGVHGNDVEYTGHYVVICGYDAETDEFEIRDPASSRKHERVLSKRLEEARKSFGTDEDLLLISLEESRRPNYSVV